MDRNIVYAGSIPLETDILNINRNVMIGLGRLAMDVLGSSTVASGLACTQTVVPSMSVAIGPGALYSVQPVDSSAYSSLPANTTDQVMKQGILPTSANKQLTLTAPGSPGTSIIYLIQAALSEVDANPVILPYYNASNPAVAYSGPGGTGTAQNTTRPVTVNVTAKAGTAASSPTPPAPDTGFVPLYYVQIAYGATTVVNANISVASGAPFLGAYAPLNSPAFTGTPTAPTPPKFDSSNKVASTAFVQQAVGNVSAVLGSLTDDITLTAAQAGAFVDLAGSAARTLTLPSPASCPTGVFYFNNFGAGTWTITTPAGNINGSGQNGSQSSYAFTPSRCAMFISDGTNWVLFLSATA